MNIRAFIALPLDDDLRAGLRASVQRHEQADRYHEVRWIPPENYHVTLQFLGDVRHADLPDLRTALADALAGAGSAPLEFTELSYFPFSSRPKMVLAMLQPGRQLLSLHDRILSATRGQGLVPDKRRFMPHVTLGRLRARRTPKLEIPPTPLYLQSSAERVVLYRSELDRAGARYYEQFDIALGVS